MTSKLNVIQENDSLVDLVIQDSKEDSFLSLKNIKERYSGMKIAWHPEKLKSFAENKITAPIHVRVKPTNACNHKCVFCSYDPDHGDLEIRDQMTDRRAVLSREKLMETIDDFHDMGVQSVTFSGGGEPLLHPNILEALKKVRDYGIKYAIITHGQFLDGEKAEILRGANWVRVSIDASDAQSLAEFRRIPEEAFERINRNIKNFAKIKNEKCELGINYVVHRDNANQVYKSVGHYKNLGVNHVKITPMWVTNFREYHEPIVESVIDQIKMAKEDFDDDSFRVYDTYEMDFSGVSVAHRNYTKCYVMQMNPVVGADGWVYFCHDKAYSSTGRLGSIKNQSFKELWFSDEAKAIFESFNPQEGCKHHCAGDQKNEMITSLVSCHGDDMGFV